MNYKTKEERHTVMTGWKQQTMNEDNKVWKE